MATVPGARRAALAFIFITVLLDILALGVVIPILPKLLVEFIAGDQARAARIFGLFATVWAAMQLIFSPVIGSLSDRFGRRRVILISSLGLAFDYVIMALAPTWQWLFAGRIISGITAASIPTAYAYIADVSTPEKRAANFGLIGAAFGVGFVVGPALGGFLGSINIRLPFWVSAGLSAANTLYGLFVLPESLPKESRTAFSWKRANPIGSLTFLTSRRALLGLASVNFLSYVAHVVLPSTFVLYVGYRYGWNERAVGFCLALVGVCSMVVQASLVRPMVSRIGERNTLLLGTTFGIIGFLVAGWAPHGLTFLLCVPLTALWGLGSAAGMGLLSSRVGPSEQGQLQGANNSLRAVSELVGPSIFTLTFAYFIGANKPMDLPGGPFFLAAVFLLFTLAIAWKVAPRHEPPAAVTVPAMPEEVRTS